MNFSRCDCWRSFLGRRLCAYDRSSAFRRGDNPTQSVAFLGTHGGGVPPSSPPDRIPRPWEALASSYTGISLAGTFAPWAKFAVLDNRGHATGRERAAPECSPRNRPPANRAGMQGVEAGEPRDALKKRGRWVGRSRAIASVAGAPWNCVVRFGYTRGHQTICSKSYAKPKSS